MTRPPPRSTLFPYTTLFRSLRARLLEQHACDTARRRRVDVFACDQNSEIAAFGQKPLQSVKARVRRGGRGRTGIADRKSTRLNSSHVEISYAVFCLKKKKKN